MLYLQDEQNEVNQHKYNDMMKRLLFSMLAGMMALGAIAQSGKFTVRGVFESLADSVSILINDASISKSLPVSSKMQEVTFDLDDADYIVIGNWILGIDESEESDIILPAIPGEILVVSKDANGKFQVGGSQFYVDYNEAMKTVEPVNREGDEFMKELMAKLQDGVPEEQLMELYQQKAPVLLQQLSDAVMGYVKAHPDKDAAAVLIAQLPDDVESIESAAALLTERARGSVAANLYKKKLEAAKKKAAEEAGQYALEGSPAPDFTLMDINGKPLALSSLKGKWVILDFWGSWCKWCIKGIPEMKEYYAKYSGKMEILGVDCNDTVEKWKNAVAQYELPWLHVYWDKDDENGDNPLALYGVRGFPTKVVIDPQGNVAKVIVGEDPAFYEYLDEVLK